MATNPVRGEIYPKRKATERGHLHTEACRKLIKSSNNTTGLYQEGCIYKPQPPLEDPAPNVLRLEATPKGLKKADDKPVETDGLIVVQVVNNTDEPVFNPADLACHYIHVQVIGITEEEQGGGRCFGLTQSRALAPGNAIFTKFDFRNAGGHEHPIGRRDNLWALPNGCYNIKLTFAGRLFDESIRICYTGADSAHDEDLRQSTSCNALAGDQPTRFPEDGWPWGFEESPELIRDPNRRNHRGNTPLFWALANGEIDIATKLLGRGADINATNIQGWTPLFGALSQGNRRGIDFALARTELLDKSSVAPGALAHAALWGGKDLVEYLKKRGADVNDRPAVTRTYTNPETREEIDFEAHIETALEIAATFDSKKALEVLIDAGATIPNSLQHAHHPLVESALRCSGFSARYVVEKSEKLEQPVLDAALGLSAENGCYLLSEYLLEQGADPNSKAGTAGFIDAANRGEFNIVRLFLENGQQVNGRTPTSLGYFTSIYFDGKRFGAYPFSPQSILIEDLIDKVTSGNKKKGVEDVDFDSGTTALIAATGYGGSESLHTLKLLLKAGANVDDREPFGMTALIKAAEMLNFDAVEALLAADAGTDHHDRHGHTALIKASKEECRALILAEAAAKAEEPPRQAVRSCDQREGDALRIVEILLEHGTDPSLKDKEGMTALDHARRLGLSTIARKLVKKKQGR